MDMARIIVTGNHFPVKDKLKELGFVWDTIRKDWILLDLQAKDKPRIDKELKKLPGIKVIYE